MSKIKNKIKKWIGRRKLTWLHHTEYKYFGRVLKVYPSDSLVMGYKIRKPENITIAWLRKYWRDKYAVTLPKKFKVIAVKFEPGDDKKSYDYPLLKKCIKPIPKKNSTTFHISWIKKERGIQ